MTEISEKLYIDFSKAFQVQYVPADGSRHAKTWVMFPVADSQSQYPLMYDYTGFQAEEVWSAFLKWRGRTANSNDDGTD